MKSQTWLARVALVGRDHRASVVIANAMDDAPQDVRRASVELELAALADLGYDGVAGHALCGAHLLWELTAVTETGAADDVIWARQAIDALLELKQAAGAARAAGHDVIGAEVLEKHGRWFRDAADAGIVLNAARRGTLEKKRHALAPGCATANRTISGSPATCGSGSTIIPMLPLCRGSGRAGVFALAGAVA